MLLVLVLFGLITSVLVLGRVDIIKYLPTLFLRIAALFCGILDYFLQGRYAICSRHYFENFQAERLRRLKHRMKVYFDASRPDHQVC